MQSDTEFIDKTIDQKQTLLCCRHCNFRIINTSTLPSSVLFFPTDGAWDPRLVIESKEVLRTPWYTSTDLGWVKNRFDFDMGEEYIDDANNEEARITLHCQNPLCRHFVATLNFHCDLRSRPMEGFKITIEFDPEQICYEYNLPRQGAAQS